MSFLSKNLHLVRSPVSEIKLNVFEKYFLDNNTPIN